MTKRTSTTKQTAGGGFQFENEAVAYFIVHLLARSSPVDPPGGVVDRVNVQRPATEWHLDDILVTTRSRSVQHRLAISVKSNVQISHAGFPEEFVRDAWGQLLHDSSPAFDESRDYLGLLTVPANTGLSRAVFELLGLAREQDPSDLATQVRLAYRTNDTVRRLLASAECPKALAEKHSVPAGEAGRLLRRTVWLPLDFEADSSHSRGRVLESLQHLLSSGSADEARSLWTRLKEITDRLRRSGGYLDLGRLIDELHGQFDLRDFPDYGADWERLSADSRAAFSRVRSTIGGTISLPRVPENGDVDRAFAGHRVVVLLGASGAGKSAIAKTRAERVAAGGRVLWLDASRIRAHPFSDWRMHLGLSHSVGEVLRTTPVADALLVLDGLDRLYADADFATAAEFLRAVRLSDEASPWRAFITCTPEAWDRVRDGLLSHGGIRTEMEIVEIGPPTAGELRAVWQEFPQLQPLGTRYHLAPILLRPKVLDLLATRATSKDDLTTVGESDLARWFWDREVARDPQAALRAETARQLAQHFADTLSPDVSISAISTALGTVDLSGVDRLVENRVLRHADGRISFDHDLFADWVRLRQLTDMGEAGGLPNFLAVRLISPVWHRALRLYGVHLLEQGDDLTKWASAFETVGSIQAPAGRVAQDILLESTVFASVGGPGLLPDGLGPLLARDGGQLLERLLNRLFHTATIPNPAVVEAVRQRAPALEIHAAAAARIPYPFYWFGVLRLLHAHQDDVPARTRGLAARAAALWLRSTPTGWAFREQAASLAIALGEALLREKEEHKRLFEDAEPDRQVFCAVLASGHEKPEAVTQIVLEAAGRRSQRYAPPPPSEEELEAARASRSAFVGSLAWPTRSRRDPWPHGPGFRVDGALQAAVLEGDALLPLTEALPSVAREALLALLINEPSRREFDDYDPHGQLELKSPRWYPPFYARGPFRSFLVTAEREAVTAVLQLVEHATDRRVESGQRYLARKRGVRLTEVEPRTAAVLGAGREREFVGDSTVFTWCYQGADSEVIGTALMALEKHLYDQVDEGRDVTPLIERLLTESRSLAIVGLLGVFGRRHPQYLRGPLRGLLISPHALVWTLLGSESPGWRMDLPGGFSLIPEPWRDDYRAWHEMAHRKQSLRDLALLLFHNDPALQPFFEEARAALKDELQPGGRYEGWPLVKHFVAQLDARNYAEVEAGDGNTYIQYIAPPELQDDDSETLEASQRNMSLMGLPIECRRILDDDVAATPERFEALWESAQRMEKLDPGSVDTIAPPANALAGVAAVFVQRGGEWLAGYPDRAEWARATLLRAVSQESVTDALVGTMSRWGSLAFSCEALVALWGDHRADEPVRAAIAQIALHAAPDLVGHMAASAARIRERLGDDHLRLLRAILLRAVLDERIRRAGRRAQLSWTEQEAEPTEDPDSPRRELAALERSLVDGTMTPVIPGLDEIAPLPPHGDRPAGRRLSRRTVPERPISEALLMAAFRGVPSSSQEERTWLPVWERVVRETVGALAPKNDEQLADLDELPGEWGYYLMQRVAEVVAETEDRVAAQSLWGPILDLGVSASVWVSRFAARWTAYALFEGARQSVIDSWVAMIDVALSHPRWEAGHAATISSHLAGELWRNLLGFGRFGADVWTDALRPRVQLLRSRLGRWAGSHLVNPDNVHVFASFLALPAAVDLVLDGLIWLDSTARSLGDQFWGRQGRDDHPDSSVLALLNHVWSKARDDLRRHDSAFAAFQGLLQTLVSRQYPPALELADRVGGSP